MWLRSSVLPSCCGEVGERFVVIGQRADFLPALGGEVVLKLQHFKGGAFADGVFFLLGVERGLGINARLPRGLHALISRIGPASPRCQFPP